MGVNRFCTIWKTNKACTLCLFRAWAVCGVTNMPWNGCCQLLYADTLSQQKEKNIMGVSHVFTIHIYYWLYISFVWAKPLLLASFITHYLRVDDCMCVCVCACVCECMHAVCVCVCACACVCGGGVFSIATYTCGFFTWGLVRSIEHCPYIWLFYMKFCLACGILSQSTTVSLGVWPHVLNITHVYMTGFYLMENKAQGARCMLHCFLQLSCGRRYLFLHALCHFLIFLWGQLWSIFSIINLCSPDGALWLEGFLSLLHGSLLSTVLSV